MPFELIFEGHIRVHWEKDARWEDTSARNVGVKAWIKCLFAVFITSYSLLSISVCHLINNNLLIPIVQMGKLKFQKIKYLVSR